MSFPRYNRGLQFIFMDINSLSAKLTMLCRSRWLAPWRLLLVLLAALTIWGVVDVRRRGFAEPAGQHKTDLTVYTEAGAAFFDGRRPYEVCNPRGWTYVYPPILALTLAPLHVLPLQQQTMVWFFLCLAMCWGIYRGSARIVALVDRGDVGRAGLFPWLGLVAAATAALPVLNCLQRGQVSILILYLLLLGFRLVLEGRSLGASLLGGAILALPVAIKIVPILPVGILLFVLGASYLRARWNRAADEPSGGKRLVGGTLGVAAGLFLFFFLAPAAMVGWDANLRHLETWNRLVLSSAAEGTATPGFEKDTHSVRNQCLGNALYRLGNFGAYMTVGGPVDPLVDGDNPPPRMMDNPNANAILLFVRVVLLLALLLSALKLGLGDNVPLGQAAAFGLACAALLVVSPVARNHYFVLMTPAVLFVPLWLDRQGFSRAATWMAVVPGALILLQYAFLFHVGRIGLLGLGTTGWLMAAMILTARAKTASPTDGAGAGAAPMRRAA